MILSVIHVLKILGLRSWEFLCDFRRTWSVIPAQAGIHDCGLPSARTLSCHPRASGDLSGKCRSSSGVLIVALETVMLPIAIKRSVRVQADMEPFPPGA